MENKFISKDLQSKKIKRLLMVLYILTIFEMIWNLLTAFGIYFITNSNYENIKQYSYSTLSQLDKAQILEKYNSTISLVFWMAVFALFGLLAVFILFKFRLALWAVISSVISSFALVLIPSLILTNSSMGMFEFILRHCHIVLIPIIALIIWLIGMKEYKKADKSVYTSIYK